MTVTATETIRKEIFVDAAPETAFRVFTDGIQEWWPLDRHGIFGEDVASLTFEDGVDGRIVERARDGRESVWGEILAYEVSARLRFTWHPGRDTGDEPTEVEVTFRADGDGTTVVLEHSGWEALSEERRAGRADYEGGWNGVLESYRRAAAA